jgi:hypothetical protein
MLLSLVHTKLKRSSPECFVDLWDSIVSRRSILTRSLGLAPPANPGASFLGFELTYLEAVLRGTFALGPVLRAARCLRDQDVRTTAAGIREASNLAHLFSFVFGVSWSERKVALRLRSGERIYV